MSDESPGASGAPDPGAALARLQRIGEDLAGLARDFAGTAGTAAPGEWLARYRRMLTPDLPAPPPAAPEAARRWHEASQCLSALIADAAADAFRRFSAALADEQAPKIGTLRELHALWVDCGEAAWAEAAHRDEFAVAQAEWIAAFAELSRPRAGSG